MAVEIASRLGSAIAQCIGMRLAAIIIASWMLAGSTAAAVQYRKSHSYRNEYKRKTFGKRALAGAGVGGAVAHARNSPREWGRGVAGFGKRVGAGFAQHAVKNSIQYGVAGLRHEDLHYYRSKKRGFGPRLRHALVSTVVTRKTTTGKRTGAAGRVSGAMGSGLISRAWQPARLHTVSSGVATGGMVLGADAATNVAREFWPRGKHRKRTRSVRH
jgi:hypothetical protein